MIMRLSAKILLLLPLMAGYWFVHGKLATWVLWIPGMFSERPFRLAGLLLGTAVCGALAGIIFSGPVHLLYKQHAPVIAMVIAALAAAFDAWHMRLSGALPFTQVALLLDLTVFFFALPLCVLVLRRLGPNQSFKPNPLRGSA